MDCRAGGEIKPEQLPDQVRLVRIERSSHSRAKLVPYLRCAVATQDLETVGHHAAEKAVGPCLRVIDAKDHEVIHRWCPSEDDYYGYGDVRLSWAPNRHTLGLLVRPGTRKAGTELSWSYPISDRLRIYAQWWHGYGESLIDYDRKVNRFGLGIALNDWLQNQ